MPDGPGSCTEGTLDSTVFRQQEGGKLSSVPTMGRGKAIVEMLLSQTSPQPHNSYTVPSMHCPVSLYIRALIPPRTLPPVTCSRHLSLARQTISFSTRWLCTLA